LIPKLNATHRARWFAEAAAQVRRAGARRADLIAMRKEARRRIVPVIIGDGAVLRQVDAAPDGHAAAQRWRGSASAEQMLGSAMYSGRRRNRAAAQVPETSPARRYFVRRFLDGLGRPRSARRTLPISAPT